MNDDKYDKELLLNPEDMLRRLFLVIGIMISIAIYLILKADKKIGLAILVGTIFATLYGIKIYFMSKKYKKSLKPSQIRQMKRDQRKNR